MPTKRFIVRGRVQGVGFRAYVLRMAEEKGLTGEVWNRPDGAVELLVNCDDESTYTIVSKVLERGPGRVHSVEQSSAPETQFISFEIVHWR